MTDFVLATADPTAMLSHMALYGLAAIVEDGGLDDVRLSWTGGMTTPTGAQRARRHARNDRRDRPRARRPAATLPSAGRAGSSAWATSAA